MGEILVAPPDRLRAGHAARSALPVTRDLSLASAATWAVEALLVISSVLGLSAGSRLYDPAAATYPAFLGQDIMSLVVGVPVLAAASWSARAGSVRALVVWMGALFYTAYSYYFYVAGAPFSPLFPAYVAVVSMSAYGALYLLFATDLPIVRARFAASLPVRATAAFLMGLALGFAVLWAALIAARAIAGHDLDMVSRTVIALDGVVLLPLLFMSGLWLRRREPLGFVVSGLLLVKTSLTFMTLLTATALTAAWGFSVDAAQTMAFSLSLVMGGYFLFRYVQALK
jgi:hypothetical protein